MDFGRLSVLIRDSYETIKQCGVADEKGELRISLDRLRAMIRTHMTLARELGVTPLAYKEMSRELNVTDLAAEFARDDTGETLHPPTKTRQTAALCLQRP
jgi:hypothetical protein